MTLIKVITADTFEHVLLNASMRGKTSLPTSLGERLQNFLSVCNILAVVNGPAIFVAHEDLPLMPEFQQSAVLVSFHFQ